MTMSVRSSLLHAFKLTKKKAQNTILHALKINLFLIAILRIKPEAAYDKAICVVSFMFKSYKFSKLLIAHCLDHF